MPRLLWAILIVVMFGGSLAALHYRRVSDRQHELLKQEASASRSAIEQKVRVIAATGEASVNGRGWPETIDPMWFGAHPPLNPYVSDDHPWLEIAGPHEWKLSDPAIRQALTKDVAGFWYNPAMGIVRARVGSNVLDARAVELYNEVNGSTISSLFSAGVTVPITAAQKAKSTSRREPESAGR